MKWSPLDFNADGLVVKSAEGSSSDNANYKFRSDTFDEISAVDGFTFGDVSEIGTEKAEQGISDYPPVVASRVGISETRSISSHTLKGSLQNVRLSLPFTSLFFLTFENNSLSYIFI